MDATIRTERLRLSPFHPGEARELHALWTRPEVRRYLWDDQVIPGEQTEAMLRRSGELFAERGFGLWAVREEGAPELGGFGGYWYFRDPPELELVVGLAPELWGRGLATEAAIALMRFGFDALELPEVRGSTDAPNQRSIRLMERLGMRFERRDVIDGLDTVFYHALRSDWSPADPPPLHPDTPAPA